VSASILDSGALVALERNDRAMWVALKAAVLARDSVLVPTTALAQVWRGSPSQARLSQALQHCTMALFDPVAKDVGELCGRSGTPDICDAHVALIASRHGDVLYTSDPSDLNRLIAALRRRSPVIVRC
jgi:hypothetical protein